MNRITGRVVWIAGLVVLIPLLLDARKFYDDDPLEALPPPMRVEDAAVRRLSDYFDFFSNSFGLLPITALAARRMLPVER